MKYRTNNQIVSENIETIHEQRCNVGYADQLLEHMFIDIELEYDCNESEWILNHI